MTSANSICTMLYRHLLRYLWTNQAIFIWNFKRLFNIHSFNYMLYIDRKEYHFKCFQKGLQLCFFLLRLNYVKITLSFVYKLPQAFCFSFSKVSNSLYFQLVFLDQSVYFCVSQNLWTFFSDTEKWCKNLKKFNECFEMFIWTSILCL